MDSFERQRNKVIDLSNKNLEMAFELANELVDKYPTFSAAWSARSLVFWNNDEVEEALGDANHAIELQPEEPAYYFERGDYKLAIEDYDGAIQDFSDAISKGEKHNFKYYDNISKMFRAYCYCKINKFNFALKDLEYIDDNYSIWIKGNISKKDLMIVCKSESF